MNLYEGIKKNSGKSDVYNKIMNTSDNVDCILTFDTSEFSPDMLSSFIDKNKLNICFGDSVRYGNHINAVGVLLSGKGSEMKKFLKAFKKDTEEFLKEYPEIVDQVFEDDDENDRSIEAFLNKCYLMDFDEFKGAD